MSTTVGVCIDLSRYNIDNKPYIHTHTERKRVCVCVCVEQLRVFPLSLRAPAAHDGCTHNAARRHSLKARSRHSHHLDASLSVCFNVMSAEVGLTHFLDELGAAASLREAADTHPPSFHPSCEDTTHFININISWDESVASGNLIFFFCFALLAWRYLRVVSFAGFTRTRSRCQPYKELGNKGRREEHSGEEHERQRMVLTDGVLTGREEEEEVGGLREAVSSCQPSRGNERGEARYISRLLIPSFGSFLSAVEGFFPLISLYFSP